VPETPKQGDALLYYFIGTENFQTGVRCELIAIAHICLAHGLARHDLALTLVH
jgi:hypothetical protein